MLKEGTDYFEKRGHPQLVVILIIISYFLLMFGNGIVSLTHPDEVFYAQTAKEMLAHRSWLTPMIFDQPHFEKPILFFWLLASVIKWFGMTPFVARFWPAFFGILGVSVSYWIAWMLFQRKRLAFLAGLILSSCFIYLALARAVLIDMVFSVLVMTSMGFFYLGYRYKTYQKLAVFGGFVISAIAVLTKGILGLTFPATAFLIFLLFKRDLGFLRNKYFLWGLFLFVAIALPWHLLMFQWYGQAFGDEYFRNVHFNRLFVAEHAKCNTWYFYPGVMFGGLFPWSLFLLPALAGSFKHLKGKTEFHNQFLFIFSWIAAVIIYTQPAQSKLASYISPVFPALAILLGFYFDQYLQKVKEGCRPKALAIVGCLNSIFFVMLGIAAIIFSRIYRNFVTNMQLVYLFSFLIILAAVLIFVLNQRKHHLQTILAHAGVTIVILFIAFLARPMIEPWVSCRQICDIFKKVDQSKTKVLVSKFYVRGVRYYTNRELAVMDVFGKGFFSPHPIPYLDTEYKVRDFLNSQQVTYAILREGNIKDLGWILYKNDFKIEQLAEIGGKYLLRIEKI